MFVRTPRLTLRPGWIEDAPEVARAIGHEGVVRNLSRVPWPYSLADAEEFLASRCDADGAYFLICLPEDGRIIGAIGVHPAEYGPMDELGYWLTPDVWGRGYATEACRGVLAAVRHGLGIRRLQASHFVDNPASGRVLAKLGFRPTGRVATAYSEARGDDVPAVELIADLADDGDCRGPERLMAA